MLCRFIDRTPFYLAFLDLHLMMSLIVALSKDGLDFLFADHDGISPYCAQKPGVVGIGNDSHIHFHGILLGSMLD
jgi:hypothetical protein